MIHRLFRLIKPDADERKRKHSYEIGKLLWSSTILLTFSVQYLIICRKHFVVVSLESFDCCEIAIVPHCSAALGLTVSTQCETYINSLRNDSGRCKGS